MIKQVPRIMFAFYVLHGMCLTYSQVLTFNSRKFMKCMKILDSIAIFMLQ